VLLAVLEIDIAVERDDVMVSEQRIAVDHVGSHRTRRGEQSTREQQHD
jgi:hypothetical protein